MFFGVLKYRVLWWFFNFWKQKVTRTQGGRWRASDMLLLAKNLIIGMAIWQCALSWRNTQLCFMFSRTPDPLSKSLKNFSVKVLMNHLVLMRQSFLNKTNVKQTLPYEHANTAWFLTRKNTLGLPKFYESFPSSVPKFEAKLDSTLLLKINVTHVQNAPRKTIRNSYWRCILC